MNIRHIGIGLALALLSAPAFADTDGIPPGNPCLKDNGNPCNGNNGNLGDQGNADHEKVKIDKKPPPIDLSMPAVSGRGAYINQVGDGGIATVRQTAPNAYARVDQDGSRNEADVTQSGTGTAYAHSSQTGTGNFGRIEQAGAGQNVVYLTQNGTGNWAWSNQTAVGAIHNGARLTQTGNHNDMALLQDGSDNRAVLTQEGDGNGMTATQLGEGNRLIWTQQGSNLTDLQITQTGGAQKNGQLLVTQTGSNPAAELQSGRKGNSTMTWRRTTGRIAVAAFAVCGSVGTASAQVETTIDQISPPLRVILQAPDAPRTSAPPPQLSTKQESDPASPQLTTERRSAAPSSQLYKGHRSAESAEPLSRPRDGRMSSVERVEGKDRCDPATRDKRQQATCAQAIETRAAQFARPDTTPLSPEQRIVAEQRLRERSASSSGTARRLASSGGGADTVEGQEVASIVLARPTESAPEKQPEEDAAAADQAAAIVNAIINQPPN